MRSLATVVVGLAMVVATGQRQVATPQKAISQKPKCAFAGQFYSVVDPRKTAWLGFRLCNFSAGAHASLSITSGSWHGSFSLPFSTSANAGSNWQRLSREKGGCDLVLVKTGVTNASTGCTWSVASIGQSNKVAFVRKLWRAFSPPSSRIVQRHKPIKGLKGSRPAQKSPVKH